MRPLKDPNGISGYVQIFVVKCTGCHIGQSISTYGIKVQWKFYCCWGLRCGSHGAGLTINAGGKYVGKLCLLLNIILTIYNADSA